MKENSDNEIFFNRARFLVEQGYPAPTNNIENLVKIMIKKTKLKTKEELAVMNKEELLEHMKTNKPPTNHFVPKIDD